MLTNELLFYQNISVQPNGYQRTIIQKNMKQMQRYTDKHLAEPGEPQRIVEGWIIGTREVKDAMNTWITETTEQGVQRITETEVIITDPVWL